MASHWHSVALTEPTCGKAHLPDYSHLENRPTKLRQRNATSYWILNASVWQSGRRTQEGLHDKIVWHTAKGDPVSNVRCMDLACVSIFKLGRNTLYKQVEYLYIIRERHPWLLALDTAPTYFRHHSGMSPKLAYEIFVTMRNAQLYFLALPMSINAECGVFNAGCPVTDCLTIQNMYIQK